jgi:precorrin-6A/cobalt-precorrin-6A reductase
VAQGPDGPDRVLVLAGSTEAAELCERLAPVPHLDVLASFAGRVRDLRTLPCAVRVGGFGGTDGLVEELRSSRCVALVDATHPFAAQMNAHAVDAADRVGVPRIRVLRPPWLAVSGDTWIEVDDMAGAATEVAALGVAVAFLAIGRQELAPFASVQGTRFVLRSIDAPGPLPMRDVEVVLERGPFTVEGERALLHHHGIGAVVARNSGGTAGAAKLAAARALGLPVILVRRPAPPPGPIVTTVEAAERWVLNRRGHADRQG